MVDHTTLAIAVESVQTNLETRFDLANINQFDKLKHLVEQLPTRKEISLKL